MRTRFWLENVKQIGQLELCQKRIKITYCVCVYEGYVIKDEMVEACHT
jgi:hypothetical protein